MQLDAVGGVLDVALPVGRDVAGVADRQAVDVRCAAQLVDDLEHVDFDRLDRQALHRYTDELQIGFGTLHDRISATYFLTGPAATPRIT